MLGNRSQLFSLLTTSLLFSATFSTFTHGDQPRILTFQGVPGSAAADMVMVDEKKHGKMVSWGKERLLLAEGPSSSPDGEPSTDDDEPTLFNSSSVVILAAERTHRKDPLSGFNKYTGGWNISDRHYWASVAYTATPLLAIATIWFLGFALSLAIICLCHFACKRETFGYSQIAYVLSPIFLILFTVIAIIGCVVLYTSQGKFHNSLKNALEYVVNQEDIIVNNLKDVSDYLVAAKHVGVYQVSLASDVQTDIDRIQSQIDSSASDLSSRTTENSKNTQGRLDSVKLALIVVSTILLFLTILGFVFSFFGMQVLLYILVIIGWILVTATFILCGIFLLLHNVTADTCVAMNQWIENPVSRTALDDILPCVDNATTQMTMNSSKMVTSQIVEMINIVITNVSNINFSPSFPSVYYNQSGPLLPILCNPFHSSDLSDRGCSIGEVDLHNATQVWSKYVCEASAAGICVTTGRLTPTIYSQMTAGVNVSVGLYGYGPMLVDLQDCSLVRETFAKIYVAHCPGLTRYSKWIYVGWLMISTAFMLSLLCWVIYGRERSHRVHTKHQTATESAEDKRHN